MHDRRIGRVDHILVILRAAVGLAADFRNRFVGVGNKAVGFDIAETFVRTKSRRRPVGIAFFQFNRPFADINRRVFRIIDITGTAFDVARVDFQHRIIAAGRRAARRVVAVAVPCPDLNVLGVDFKHRMVVVVRPDRIGRVGSDMDNFVAGNVERAVDLYVGLCRLAFRHFVRRHLKPRDAGVVLYLKVDPSRPDFVRVGIELCALVLVGGADVLGFQRKGSRFGVNPVCIRRRPVPAETHCLALNVHNARNFGIYGVHIRQR